MEMAATKGSMPPSTAKSARRNPIVGHFCNKIGTSRKWRCVRLPSVQSSKADIDETLLAGLNS